MKYIITTLVSLIGAWGISQAPNWTVDGTLYAYNMSITATLSIDCIDSMNIGDEIGLFSGSDLRGSGKCQNDVNGNGIIFITAHSNNSNGDILTVKYYDALLDQTRDLTGNDLEFVSSEVIGNINDPYYFFEGNEPINPTIQHNEDSLEYTGNITSGISFQWLSDGLPIDGETNASFTPTQYGNYSLEVSGTGYCTQESEVVIFQTSSIIENTIDFLIYPNPTNGIVTITAEVVNAELIVSDISGRTISKHTFSNNLVLDLSKEMAGMYFITIQNQNVKTRRSIVLN